MPKELRVDLSLRVTPWALNALLGAVVVALCPLELSSDQVTLTTYYPAPSGVYNQMITTQNTYLARDNGGVGIATTSPVNKLDVNGGAAVGAPFAGASAAPSNGLIVSGSVGVGVSNPANVLQVLGNAQVTGKAGGPHGYLYVDNTNSGCGTANPAANTPVCPAGQYATFVPGVWIEGTSYENRAYPQVVFSNGDISTVVQGLDTGGGGGTGWATLTMDNTPGTIYCCPK